MSTWETMWKAPAIKPAGRVVKKLTDDEEGEKIMSAPVRQERKNQKRRETRAYVRQLLEENASLKRQLEGKQESPRPSSCKQQLSPPKVAQLKKILADRKEIENKLKEFNFDRIATQFGLTRSQVSRIARGVAWKKS